MKITVIPLDTDDPLALYDTDRDGHICIAHLELDREDGTLRCDYSADPPGDLPRPVWDGRTIWWDMPAPLVPEAANRLLRAAAPFAQRVLDRPDDSAAHQAVVDLVADYVAAGGRVAVEDADVWMEGDDLGITADTSDADLAEIVASVDADPDDNPGGVLVLLGLDEYADSVREAARERVLEELDDVVETLDAATEQRDALLTRMVRWRDARWSLRKLGAAAGLAHVTVGVIANR